MNIAQICRSIEHGQLSDRDLTDVITAVKYAGVDHRLEDQ